jgi:hypothetical protein
MRVKLTTTARAARWTTLLVFALIVTNSGPKMFTEPTTGWRVAHAIPVVLATISVLWHWLGRARFRRTTE